MNTACKAALFSIGGNPEMEALAHQPISKLANSATTLLTGRPITL